jgi:hypothetical protein
MATIKIEPLVVQSLGGNRVHILGLRPTYQDCIVGEYWTKKGDGPHSAVWDLSGLMRGGTDPLNLSMKGEELAELAELAIQLGARR